MIDLDDDEPNVETDHVIEMTIDNESQHHDSWLTGIGIRYVDSATNLEELDEEDVTVRVDDQDVETDDENEIEVSVNDDMLEIDVLGTTSVTGEETLLRTNLESGDVVEVELDGVENPPAGEYDLAVVLESSDDRLLGLGDRRTTAETEYLIGTPPTLVVESIGVDDAYVAGSTVDVPVTVRNDGDWTDERDVDLRLEDEPLLSSSVAPPPDESETVTADEVALPAEDGTFTLGAETAADEKTKQITIRPERLDVALDSRRIDRSTDPNATVEFETNRDERVDLELDIEGLTAVEVAEVFSVTDDSATNETVTVSLADGDELVGDFGGVESGAYELVVVSTDTGAVGTTSFEVVDKAEDDGGSGEAGEGDDGDGESDESDEDNDSDSAKSDENSGSDGSESTERSEDSAGADEDEDAESEANNQNGPQSEVDGDGTSDRGDEENDTTEDAAALGPVSTLGVGATLFALLTLALAFRWQRNLE